MCIFSSRITTNQQLLCSQLSGYDIEIGPSQKADSFLRSVSCVKLGNTAATRTEWTVKPTQLELSRNLTWTTITLCPNNVLTLKMTFRNIVHLYTFVCFFTSYIYFECERSYLSLGDVISEASLCSCAAVKWQKAAARTAPILTDCHERVGELVLLFGWGELVFEGELLQWFAPLQWLGLPLALHHLLQAQTYTNVWGRQRQRKRDSEKSTSWRKFYAFPHILSNTFLLWWRRFTLNTVKLSN